MFKAIYILRYPGRVKVVYYQILYMSQIRKTIFVPLCLLPAAQLSVNQTLGFMVLDFGSHVRLEMYTSGFFQTELVFLPGLIFFFFFCDFQLKTCLGFRGGKL